MATPKNTRPGTSGARGRRPSASAPGTSRATGAAKAATRKTPAADGGSAPAKTPRIRLKPVTPRDLPHVAELFGALHAFNATFDKHFELADDWPTHLAEVFTRSRDQPDSLWVLAWDGREAVGMIVAETHFDPPIFRRRYWLELSALYVKPSHRRFGVARRLVDHLLDWARERSFDTVQLYVSAANTGARDFYAREGFTVLQEIWRKRILLPDTATPPLTVAAPPPPDLPV
jgi:GNAT superfamily N-acetyltransferase